MHRYTYTLLRYTPDIVSGEAVNVGVVVHCPGERFFSAKFRQSVGRVSKIFPDMDQAAFRKYLKVLDRCFSQRKAELADGFPYESEQTAVQLAKKVLPADASAFQWAEDRGGLTRSSSGELEKLFYRFVGKFDDQNASSKTTEKDLLQKFNLDLEARQILNFFQPKTILAPYAELSVKKAFKNGIWHCFEPVSFDLSDEGHISSKAYRWLGQLSAVREADERFKVYFLVAKPSDPSLNSAFNDAMHLLSNCGDLAKVYKEENIANLGDDLEDIVKSSPPIPCAVG
ncbi:MULTISPECIES: DUF3037 domain-containing protein [unclassified Thalassospira]|uniref:DUF3037 domain-containing protein n=1 Tax=unclassified Thalassospira TaxID=2648997 RepID=UPI001B1137C7|nr:DUF3037 domain-containing protein [Thalassospira sp.]MBO6772889.1 DUF3037 domain-containing protein [Thalassospira sp.]